MAWHTAFGWNYCPVCEMEVQTTIVEKEETYNVLSIDRITITASVCTCCFCKSEIWNDYLDDQNLKKAYRIFQAKHPEIDFKAKECA